MNDELKRWIEDTEAKAAIMMEAAKRARDGEDVTKFAVCDGCDRNPSNWLPRWDFYNHRYTLKPRRRLRPWTAKEWGARIGDGFLVSGRKSVLKTVDPSWLMFDVGDACITIYTSNKSDMETITQLDGSPCGEWEEVK